MAIGMMTMVSCTRVETTVAAHRYPVEKRVILENHLKSSDSKILLASADSRFGGFDPMKKFWGTAVGGGVVLSVNGQQGTRRGRDPRGTFMGDGAMRLTSEPGPMKIVVKPLSFHDGNPISDHHIQFTAKPGHRYFIGYATSSVGDGIRWVPVVYDRTEQKEVPLPGIKPKFRSIPPAPYGTLPIILPVYL